MIDVKLAGSSERVSEKRSQHGSITRRSSVSDRVSPLSNHAAPLMSCDAGSGLNWVEELGVEIIVVEI